MINQRHPAILDGDSKYYIFACLVFLVSSIHRILGIGWGMNGGFNSFPLSDSFHFGEFFAATQAILSGSSLHPYVLHGASDIFPSLILSTFLSPNKVIFGSILLYQLFGLLSSSAFILLLLRLTKHSEARLPLMLLGAFISVYALNYRDLFLVLSLYIYICTRQRHDLRSFSSQLLALSLGIALCLNLYWSFNRGIVALVAFGLILLWESLFRRTSRFALLVFVASSVIVGFWLYRYGYIDYISNIKLLLSTSDQWSYPLNRSTLLIAFATVIVVSSSVLAGLLLVPSFSFRRIGDFTYVFLFIILSLLMLRLSLNRIALINSYYAIWIPLLFIAWHSQSLRVFDNTLRRTLSAFGFYLSVLALGASVLCRSYPLALSAIFLVYVHGFWGAGLLRRNYLHFLVALLLVPPLLVGSYQATKISVNLVRDSHLAGSSTGFPGLSRFVHADELEVATYLNKVASSCVFDFTNSGLIHFASGRGMCSQMTYPVYANLNYQDQMAAELSLKKPSHVIYSTSKWFYSIDGKSMPMRFPKLDQLIKERYPNENCFASYCIRSAPAS